MSMFGLHMMHNYAIYFIMKNKKTYIHVKLTIAINSKHIRRTYEYIN